MSSSEPEIDTEDELLMHTYETLPNRCKKYWRKRYDLFSKYDEGIYLTADLWYSVTPEACAKSTARIVRKLLPSCENILEVCCGGGGNVIQFARYFKSVGAIDINANNIKCSQHNCALYGQDQNTWFLQADWRELADSNLWIPDFVPGKKFDFVFASPPWGGPRYKHKDTYDLFTMAPLDLRFLCHTFCRFSDNFGLFLPRNLDFDQIQQITKELYGSKAQTRVVCLRQNGRALGILAFFGPDIVSEAL